MAEYYYIYFKQDKVHDTEINTSPSINYTATAETHMPASFNSTKATAIQMGSTTLFRSSTQRDKTGTSMKDIQIYPINICYRYSLTESATTRQTETQTTKQKLQRREMKHKLLKTNSFSLADQATETHSQMQQLHTEWNKKITHSAELP